MTLSHRANHVNSVRYATDLTYIGNLAYDILAEAWDLERGGYGRQMPVLVPASLEKERNPARS